MSNDSENRSDIEQKDDPVIYAYENGYDFPSLDSVRAEVCLCLCYGLNQAAITLTNHLLESALKKFLILAYTKEKESTECDIRNVFDEGTKLYANMNLDTTINKACTNGLINKTEKKALHDFRVKYSNGFSHADPTKTFSSSPLPARLVKLKDNETQEEVLKQLNGVPNVEVNPQTAIFLQGLLQKLTADAHAESYFLSVDENIRNIIKRMRDK